MTVAYLVAVRSNRGPAPEDILLADYNGDQLDVS